MNFKGKTALVTGAAVGIGRAAALVFAERGANLVLVDMNYEKLKDVKKEKIAIDEAFLGSCNNGRIDDLRVAAEIVKEKQVDPKVRFIVAPASKAVYIQALEEGIITTLMEAGAMVMNCNCSVCWGSCQGVIGENEVLISTGTRNFKGRAGAPSSKVYLASAATVAASALAGYITGPED